MTLLPNIAPSEIMIEILGGIAGVMTTSAFLPQVIKTWKSRSAKDVSLAMYIVLCIGISLWILFGILKSSTSIVSANSVTLGLAVSMLVMKMKFK